LSDTSGHIQYTELVAAQKTGANKTGHTRTIVHAVGAAALLGGLGLASVATAKTEVVRSIRFEKGARSGVLADAVVRGERRTYEFTAWRGQHGRIVISAAENNAVFQLFLPAELVPNASKVMIAGPEARTWSGSLPRTGTYRIIVSGTRGNATYRLQLTVS
jgi:hypothetical protein